MIVKLKEASGLEVKLDTDKPELIFAAGMNFSSPGIRTLEQMREVLLDKELKHPQEFYYMYRDVHMLSDKNILQENSLRYDITVIRPDYLGKEMMKTAGHYHPGSFGELYEVVYGRCYCMLQKHDSEDHKKILEVIVVEARAGQKIVIPPGFGHILVNPGPGYLVTSNWVSSVFSSEYDLYKKASGAAYFVVKSNKGGADYIPNLYFADLPKIKFVSPAKVIEVFGLREDRPIYNIIRQNVQRLDFLNRPLDFDYSDVFVSEK